MTKKSLFGSMAYRADSFLLPVPLYFPYTPKKVKHYGIS